VSTDWHLKGGAAGLIVAISVAAIGTMMGHAQQLRWALAAHDLRLIPLGITADQLVSPTVTLEDWHATPVPLQTKNSLLRLVSAGKGSLGDADSPAFARLFGSIAFIKSFLDEVGAVSGGEGGPYIALGNGLTAQLASGQILELQRLTTNLPLGIPLRNYELSSGFGARVDPINHDPAFHLGLDMEAPYRSEVYATGTGTVIFTGNMNGYGRVIEIDHGHDVITRYAHLHRILVAKGQKVRFHTVIGEVGSTGRSTGPHLHYEIRVAGAAIDPAQFMRLGDTAAQFLRTRAAGE
jgi:hypothetical protein